MSKLITLEHNCTTNEVIMRDFTKEEMEVFAAQQIEANLKLAEIEAKLAAKASAQAKLAALGLTADEVAAIVGN